LRILVYSHNFQREGAPIILLRLLRALKDRHEIEVLRLVGRDHEPLLAEYEKLGIKIAANVRPSRYDVALFNTVTASQYVAKTVANCPVVWWVHEPRFGLLYFQQPNFAVEAFEMASRIVFPTLWQARTLYQPYLKRQNWTVVPYGIGMDLQPRVAPFEREPGRFYLLHLGRVDRRKGQDLSARALKHLDDPGITLVCVGNRPPDDPYCAKLDEIGADVRYAGSVPEETVAAYIQHCDAMVFPTRDDLITLAILEGLSFSKCVLASDFGPIPETIIQGRTGLLSPVDDWRVLAGNIRMVRADAALAEQLGRQGRKILEQKHSFEAHVAAMEKELERAANG
jgi:glycosyltransferase involved in cell wall biosynthesis